MTNDAMFDRDDFNCEKLDIDEDDIDEDDFYVNDFYVNDFDEDDDVDFSHPDGGWDTCEKPAAPRQSTPEDLARFCTVFLQNGRDMNLTADALKISFEEAWARRIRALNFMSGNSNGSQAA